MSISSSLNAGIMGLAVNAARLSTISDNIANSGTYGYKRSQVDFSSMVLNQRENAYSAGGVRVVSYKAVNENGSLISTGNATDIAIAGRGLIPVTNQGGVNALASERNLQLVPTGSFFADQNGNLRTQSGLFLLGWPADTGGNIGNVSRNSSTGLEPVNIAANQLTASATRNINLGINLPADATAAGQLGEAFDLPTDYYDNLGRTQTLTYRFTPIVPATGASNQWTIEVFDGAGDPNVSIAEYSVTFADDSVNGGKVSAVTAISGGAYDPATGEISLNVASGPINTFIGRINDSSGLTQFSAPFSPTSVTKDGSPIGDLSTIEIDSEGFVQAIYDTGFRRTLYQIPVGDVPNLNGLIPRDDQSFSVSAASGSIYFWDAGTGPVGTMEGFALMQSTTDVASELTDLIETQRAYSSNATIIRTVDEMLQETTNLKR